MFLNRRTIEENYLGDIKMGEITIVVPEGLEEEAKKMINELKRRKDILDKTFGLIKTKKSAEELKVDLYEELSNLY